MIIQYRTLRLTLHRIRRIAHTLAHAEAYHDEHHSYSPHSLYAHASDLESLCTDFINTLNSRIIPDSRIRNYRTYIRDIIPIIISTADTWDRYRPYYYAHALATHSRFSRCRPESATLLLLLNVLAAEITNTLYIAYSTCREHSDPIIIDHNPDRISRPVSYRYIGDTTRHHILFSPTHTHLDNPHT